MRVSSTSQAFCALYISALGVLHMVGRESEYASCALSAFFVVTDVVTTEARYYKRANARNDSNMDMKQN